MLSEQQLATLRSGPAANRVAKAISFLAEAVGLTQPYVSDVARGRYRTITVERTVLRLRNRGLVSGP